ncbi:hypothetical protein QA648_36555 (plasmid) [Rhizobium sp. CB3171]|uniref:hypothetical protein n=1 Tax=Rhizobium sp. CB3171 TaxID=3039157 RepID=UPI0024B1AFDF|nr:hypothetical protein [Rhizobium sp. CB3171]WFU07443.1 hypothetical protein QA648_36555 [Rhizobium sp. CB3171]
MIGELRYRLFIKRDGKNYEHADHRNKIFLEPVDLVSANFYAMIAGTCGLSVRLTSAADCLSDRHLSLIVEHSRLTDAELEGTVLNSRFAVVDDNRMKLRIPVVLREIYRVGMESGALRCLLAARAELVPLFARFGFAPLGGQYHDPVAGLLQIMVLNAFDRTALLRCSSPLLKTLDQFISQERFRHEHESVETAI